MPPKRVLYTPQIQGLADLSLSMDRNTRRRVGAMWTMSDSQRSQRISEIWRRNLDSYRMARWPGKDARITAMVMRWLRRVRDSIASQVSFVGMRTLEERNRAGFANAIQLD